MLPDKQGWYTDILARFNDVIVFDRIMPFELLVNKEQELQEKQMEKRAVVDECTPVETTEKQAEQKTEFNVDERDNNVSKRLADDVANSVKKANLPGCCKGKCSGKSA